MKQTVLITGAQTGTGYAIAEQFARNGWNVVITSRNAEAAEAAAARITQAYSVVAKGYACNIREEQKIVEMFQRIDREGLFVKTVVLNAADMGFGTDPAKGQDFWSVSAEEFARVFETNLVWNFMIIRQAALRMKERGEGAVVFIGSNTAYRAIPNRAAYCASKGGINALSKALALDLGLYGIRCNVVLSGTIKTDRWREMGSRQIVNGTLTPIGEISDYEDIANAAWYLGSELSKNVTGTELTVDGGMSCQLYPRKLSVLLQAECEGKTETAQKHVDL